MILHCPEKDCPTVYRSGQQVNGVRLAVDNFVRAALQHHLWMSHNIPAEEAWAKVNAISRPAGSREVRG